MTFLIATLSILATVGLLAYMYRDKLENFAPGWKTTITNAVITVAGLAAGIVAMFVGLTPQDLVGWGFSIEKASAIVTAIGVINLILSFVTKRTAPAPVGPEPTQQMVEYVR